MTGLWTYFLYVRRRVGSSNSFEVTFWWRRNKDSMTEYAHVLVA